MNTIHVSFGCYCQRATQRELPVCTACAVWNRMPNMVRFTGRTSEYIIMVGIPPTSHDEMNELCALIVSGEPGEWSSRRVNHGFIVRATDHGPELVYKAASLSSDATWHVIGPIHMWAEPMQYAARVCKQWHACYVGRRTARTCTHYCYGAPTPEDPYGCCSWANLLKPKSILRMMTTGVSDQEIHTITTLVPNSDEVGALIALLMP